MKPATQARDTICTICGECEDARTGLCLACLMQSATETGDAETFDIFADDTDAPRIGSYELLDEIGRGGMGVIYKARQLHTGRLVAVKILQSQIAHKPELLARFRREAETAARLDHRHVLPIYEVNDEADGVPFFTMKLATGGSLVERKAALQGHPREIAALIAKVARAAHHAHERGVLHRDLKPGNILFDDQGEPMVSDFGIAAWLHQESDLTQTIAVVGTPGYLPPEYIHGRPDVLQAASDIYSLGVILFELLAGQQPLAAATCLSAIQKAMARPAPRLRTIIPGADRDLEVICSRCLEVEPGLRYGTAIALAEDLERWLAGRPIVARPVSPLVRAWKLARRRPTAFFTTLLVVCLTIGGLVLYHSRTQVSAQLQTATAYDRSVVLLLVEDLDALRYDSPLAMQASSVLAEKLGGVSDLISLTSAEAPDPLPHAGALVSFSKRLGGRYLVSATVRRRGDTVRLAVHFVDASRDTVLRKTINDAPALDSPSLLNALDAGIRGFTKGPVSPSAPPTADADRSVVSDDNRRRAAEYLRAGDGHYRRMTLADTELAIAAYQKALALDPYNSEAHATMANVFTHRASLGERSKWLSAALPFARRAAELDPLSSSAPQTRSLINSALGKPELAVDDALSAFEIDREEAYIVNTVAEAYFALGMTDRALFWHRRLDRRDHAPGNVIGYRADYLASIGEFREARSDYQEVVEFRGELPDGEMGSIHVDLLDGKASTAVARVRDLAARFPTDPAVSRFRAAIELFAGDPGEAEKLYAASGDDDLLVGAYLPTRPSSGLGYLAMRRGDRVNGLEKIKRALALDEQGLTDGQQDPSLLFERACNHALLGNVEEALRSLEEAAARGRWTFFHIRLDPRLESLRRDPRFDALSKSLEQRLRELRERCQASQEAKSRE